MTMTGARFFQFYLDNYFKFPKEIKNDIIYCQRALKAHIKVHQMVVEKFKQEDGNSSQKRRILEELETEIYEINAEQHYLLLRLRRVIDEFYKSVQRGGMPVDTKATNQLISKEVVPHIDDESMQVHPVTVLFRNTEEKLIEKYLTPKKEMGVCEILDTSDDCQIVLVTEKKRAQPNSNSLLNPLAQQTSQPQQIQIKTEINSTPNGVYSGRNGLTSHLSQVSLLKPMSQRIIAGPNIGRRSLYPEQKTKPSVTPDKSTYSRPAPYDVNRNTNPSTTVVVKEEPGIELPVSKNVTLSRLNLRQALKKARTDTMAAAKATANILTKPSGTTAASSTTETSTPTPPPPPAPAPTPLPTVAVKTKAEPKTRAAKAASVAQATKTIELNSSSEDSPTERDPTPPHVLWPREPEEHKTHPDDYGQEMFLRLFGLFTPEMHVHMQQRRSKRKRRTVYNNERADFHYGRIDHGPQPSRDKERRKAFLLSPQVKRGLQTKKPKRAEKTTETASRSSSSSPDEKRACNECLKGGGSIEKCDECKGYFHPACHPEDMDIKTNAIAAKRSLTVDHQKLCPACSRTQMTIIKKEAQQYETLNSTVHELEKKMAKEKHRRASLQHTSKLYKIQMRNLFNIVKTIKSDNENDSSE